MRHWHSHQAGVHVRDPTARGVRAAQVGMVVNAGLAAVKLVAGLLGNTYALIADAAESCADVFGSLLVWGGLAVAARPADEDHPYGHGKAEPLAAMVVALALFAAAAFIAYESVKQIVTPHYTPAPFTLVVLVLVIITKELLFRFVFKVGDAVGSTAVKSDAWHHRSDAITSAAAFVGISIALVGGKGYESADDWAALLASGIIVFNAYRLVRPALAELTDASPAFDAEHAIRGVAMNVAGVRGTHKCFVRKMGFDYYVDLDVVVDGRLTVRDGHNIAHQVQNAIREANPLVAKVFVHVEPDDPRRKL